MGTAALAPSFLRTVSQGWEKTTPANKPPRSTFTSDKPTATHTAAPSAPKVNFYKICIHKHKQQRRQLLSCNRKKLSEPSALHFKSPEPPLCRGGEHILLGLGWGHPMLTLVGAKPRAKIWDITPINIQPWDSGCFMYIGASSHSVQQYLLQQHWDAGDAADEPQPCLDDTFDI